MLPTFTIVYALTGIICLTVVTFLHFDDESLAFRCLITMLVLIGGAPVLLLFYLIKRYV